MTYRQMVVTYLEAHGRGTAKSICTAHGVSNVQSMKMVMLEMRRAKQIVVGAVDGRQNVFTLPTKGKDIGFRHLRKIAKPTPELDGVNLKTVKAEAANTVKLGDEYFEQGSRFLIPPEARVPVPGWYFPRPPLPLHGSDPY